MRPSNAIAALVLACIVVRPAGAQSPQGDVFDQFFRYTETGNRPFFHGMPGETVDPFTGTLQITQTDLVLPGRAGLDLRIVRTYSSKIWGRADLLDPSGEPLLAEKEPSVLGYGWSFHMGRLKDPWAEGGASICGNAWPLYEAPDGSSHVFYRAWDPNGPSSVFVSKDYWRLDHACPELGGQGACVWSDTGVRYEFRSSNQLFYGTATPVWPLSAIVDPFGNRISVAYRPDGRGIVTGITDSYGRVVTFEYSSGLDGDRLVRIAANGKAYSFEYAVYGTTETGGAGRYPLPGSRRFLKKVSSPAGPPFSYEYAYDVPVANNQYALKTITYPAGGWTTYSYEPFSFFTGLDAVEFAAVARRKLGGRGVPEGEWTYSYHSPGPESDRPLPGTNMQLTTITRPDGRRDVYSFYGFGWVAAQQRNGYTYLAGLPFEISRGDGTEIERFHWNPRTDNYLSHTTYSAPLYSASCGAHYVWDEWVVSPVVDWRAVLRDGAWFLTESSQFDPYGQPQLVVETGANASGLADGSAFVTGGLRRRSTWWTYFSNPGRNIVRDRPTSQYVCIEGKNDCVSNGWTYDGFGAKRSETLSNVTTGFDYHPDGNLLRVTNALGQRLELTGYDLGWGTPTHLDFNGAFSIDRQAYWEGWVKSQTNGHGYATQYEYDAIGRPRLVTPPAGTLGQPNVVTTYVYEPDDGSHAMMTRGGYTMQSWFDGMGRVTSTEDSEGVLTSIRYDPVGRAWFKSYPYSRTTGEMGDRTDFDWLDRVTTLTKAYRPDTGACDAPGACATAIRHSVNCTDTTVHRAAGSTQTTAHCAVSFGDPRERRLAAVIDGLGHLWQYDYTTQGAIQETFGPYHPLELGKRTYAYDPVTNFLMSERSGESGAVVYERNAIGQVKSRTDARGIRAIYDYDALLSRLETITYAGGSSDNVSRGYDRDTLKRFSSAEGGAYELFYDELDRVKQRAWTFGGRTYATKFDYDAVGCLASLTYPTGTRLTMTCDSANRVASISIDADTLVANVSYHPSQQVEQMTYGNGIVTRFRYDDRGRVQGITTPGVAELAYAYDGADNVTSIVDSVIAGSERWMSYDALDRLETATAPSLWGTAVYQYDALGNRTFKSVGSTTTNVTYGVDGRIVSATGNESFPSLTFTWDPAGHLASSSDGASYGYDAEGRRVVRTDGAGTTLYHHDAAGRVIAETLPDGTKLREFFYLGNMLLAVDGCVDGRPPGCPAQRQWYHTDRLGSVVARTDPSGVVVARLDYQSWGERGASAAAGDRQYNGRVFDPGTGFHDYGARMYWPQIGRFVSADTYAGDVKDPSSLNRYSYVLNNPYKYVDPDGKTPLVVAALAVAAAGGVGAAIGSYIDTGRVDWNHVGKWTSTGFLVGLTGGLSLAASGGAAATDAAAVTQAAAPAAAGAAAGAAQLSRAGDALLRAEPTGSALKGDMVHRAATFMREAAARTGTHFDIVGDDGKARTLTQMTGKLNDLAGRYEYIVDGAGKLTHQMFVKGGAINGVPIKP